MPGGRSVSTLPIPTPAGGIGLDTRERGRPKAEVADGGAGLFFGMEPEAAWVDGFVEGEINSINRILWFSHVFTLKTMGIGFSVAPKPILRLR